MTFLGAKYEKAVRSEKIYKLSSAFLILLSLSVLVWIVCMAPSYFVIILSKDDILRRVDVEEAVLARRKLGDLEAETVKINKIISDYGSNEAKRRSFSGLLISVFRASPQGISIDGVVLSKNKDGVFILNLQGNASVREELISYVSVLEKLPAFSEVDSPISNLLEESNARFNLNLKINPEAYKL
ncbi:hypothetical protein A2662_00190 [Candidatus Giovannonibacteria bacterium RIFCSPHIGHO2_01_FULL_45_33]|uniref:Uncharacterized protein n=1 Tax=Candidatus Giovannonibacteria bacterium RIFCSPLOWO2_01_FULL_45_34 TaxID=1798351 RepID=A0A1F5X0P2_9BACT|nr:MAG: hypothetical protein A2662_00190 [Candidatus Giovannonibacteria bacterium RIFCSPHIGHO2_01_FULL_45_33]OGF70749.1 MAG: hypothetical protein A3C73_03215 [Candidatus Giovannonibacteria bacterium RIFCSPHIGHO2_02_FULL_44_11]OGF81459.1 MAG: hypothetical protein A2930_04415 [Candidatus Giovannonibacteria bacterium RIFCSPLOWO2_01_FULL_45_34]